MAESKASKKNRKRTEKKLNAPALGGFDIVEDMSEPTETARPRPEPPTQPTLDPIADLKRQIEEAKAAKDHVKAQELRQKMWVLQDTMLLGKAGPGAPEVDLQDVLPSKPKDQVSAATVSSSSDPTDKKLSRLRKKLAQIEALKARQEKGEKLEATQITKIETEAGILEEISLLEELLAGVQ